MKDPQSLFLREDMLGIVTDFYQLSMAAGYFEQKMRDITTFELFVRRLPDNRSYLITAGLEQALHYLSHITFSREAIQFLKELSIFRQTSQKFFEYLENFCFTGTVHALPEGTITFPEEPMLRVTAPIIEAQIIETYLLSIMSFQTSIATKAARIVSAAQGKNVIDFGTRRAHGPQAGVLAARSCFIGGCTGTSNVYAAYKLNIPAMGTVAHSWVMAFEKEQEAFIKFHEIFPENTLLVIDTYDTLAGARHAAVIGKKLKGVRIDSGNLLELSKKVRKFFDTEGLHHVQITASGDLNEDRIDYLVKNGAPIDMFGVGTEMVTSKDAPALGGVYKLVEQEQNGRVLPRMKTSKSKGTYPCKKQIYRFLDDEGNLIKDVIGLENEDIRGTPLLVPVIKEGKICYNLPAIRDIQEKATKNLAHLPESFKRLHHAKPFPVIKSQGLEQKKKELEQSLRNAH
ncbi:MAG: nicotinate phosphoribosyltransferase [Candidatus Brocadiaceae bacterium]|nr:nicotinate phosphoribosyltransferase [Candidatus Brocadiaceae bacterium]